MNKQVITLILNLLIASRGSMKNYIEPEGPSSTGEYVETLPAPTDTIKIVSYNIRYGRKIDEAMDELAEQEPLFNPDIVLLQEMDSEGVEKIANRFGFNYVYFPVSVHRKHGKDFGNAILSKWPIKDTGKVILPHEHPFSKQRRIAAAATIVFGGREIRAYSVHTETFWLSHRKRIAQIDSLIKSVPDGFDHVIIGGDFNTSFSNTMRVIDELFNEAGFLRASEGIGYTAREGPFGVLALELDHIFTKGMTAIGAGKVEATAASDHLPIWLVAEIRCE
jgi:endonuclease/exonuclease/phosphatase family metal-dependent hydrolase